MVFSKEIWHFAILLLWWPLLTSKLTSHQNDFCKKFLFKTISILCCFLSDAICFCSLQLEVPKNWVSKSDVFRFTWFLGHCTLKRKQRQTNSLNCLIVFTAFAMLPSLGDFRGTDKSPSRQQLKSLMGIGLTERWGWEAHSLQYTLINDQPNHNTSPLPFSPSSSFQNPSRTRILHPSHSIPQGRPWYRSTYTTATAALLINYL